ncbi:MAG: DUF4384 domain-containing protein [Spirochaetota bacterium]
MRRIKLCILPMILLSAFPLLAQSPALSWKAAFLRYDRGQMESLPFSRPLSLKDGNQFQLLVQPASDAYVDLLYEDTAGTVQVLYQGQVKGGQALFLPDEAHNFTISPPAGTEKIHIIVSTKKQTTLEARFKALPKESAAALDELARLKTALLSIAQAPEKPVPMGGVNRALSDVKVAEFGGAETYVKTIRFDH